MKNILIMVLSGFLFFSCQEKNAIEVIPNYDEIYLPLNKVDETPQLLEGNEKKLSEKIDDEIKKNKQSDIKIDYKLMIDEHGNVKKVEVVKSPDAEFTNIAVKEFENWKFIPGKKEGKAVKSQYRWYFNQALSKLNIDQKDYLIVAEIMPEVVGGLNSIQEKISYPELAKRAGIEGKVYVLTFINENGDVAGAVVIKGIGAGCDEEALNAVKSTKFTPAKDKGKNVKVQVTVPISFRL
jgi:TonB family protein